MDKKETSTLDKCYQSTYKIRVRRGNSDVSWYDEFDVPNVDGQSVLGALQYIYEHLDASLAYTSSCRIGLCGGCLVRVNGKVVHACTTIMKGDIVIEPFRQSHIAKDLIVNQYSKPIG
jgi:succinate dehydrogenase/fumarate reductase-like Fe-S protein